MKIEFVREIDVGHTEVLNSLSCLNSDILITSSLDKTISLFFDF